MEYARLINGIAACMGNEARTFTRYNKSVTQGEGSEAHMKARDTKMVVVDYKNTDVSFHLRAGQIAFNGTPFTNTMMIEHIKKEDPSLVIQDSFEDAIMHSIGPKYLYAVSDICDIIKCYVKDRNDKCQVQYGSLLDGEGNPAISIFVECEDMVVVLTVKE